MKATVSDVIAAEVVRLRRAAGLTQEQLAKRCADLGWPDLTYGVIGSIETGRPKTKNGPRTREVSVDEVAGLAAGLEVSVLTLLAHGLDVRPPTQDPLVQVREGLRTALVQLDSALASQRRIPSSSATLAHLSEVVREMPAVPFDPAAVAEVAREVREWARSRQRVNSVLLGDEPEEVAAGLTTTPQGSQS